MSETPFKLNPPPIYDEHYAATQETDDDRTNAERWQWLANLKCNSLTLARDDDHACNYMTAAEWIERDYNGNFKHVPPDEVQRMKDTNTIWSLQVYPNTPVGFNIWYGATAESAIDQAMADYAA